MNNNTRIKKYSNASTILVCLSNDKLKQILIDATPIHKGIGGTSVLISIDAMPVFVKKTPLTDNEFFQKLQKGSKSTPYPKIQLEELIISLLKTT